MIFSRGIAQKRDNSRQGRERGTVDGREPSEMEDAKADDNKKVDKALSLGF